MSFTMDTDMPVLIGFNGDNSPPHSERRVKLAIANVPVC